MNAQRRRCDNGSGESCYTYAMMLRRFGSKANFDQANRFVRKACQMSYAPACQETAPTRKLKKYKL